jgi:hypothetical protein
MPDCLRTRLCAPAQPTTYRAATWYRPSGEAQLERALRYRQDVERTAVQHAEIQLQRAEGESRGRPGEGGAGAQRLQQAAEIERRHDQAEQAVALRNRADLRQPFQHQRRQAGQPQLDGQQQPGRAAAGDHDVGRVLVHVVNIG